MKPLPTAEQWVNNHFEKQITGSESYPDVYASKEGVVQSHIIFAKMHVEAALKAASESTLEYDFTEEITSSYPIENIK